MPSAQVMRNTLCGFLTFAGGAKLECKHSSLAYAFRANKKCPPSLDISRTRALHFVLPPQFAYISQCKPQQVRIFHRYSDAIMGAPSAAYAKAVGTQLQDWFSIPSIKFFTLQLLSAISKMLTISFHCLTIFMSINYGHLGCQALFSTLLQPAFSIRIPKQKNSRHHI